MSEEVKEILDCFKSHIEQNESMCCLSMNEVPVLLDYITNLQNQLNQASLDIQELTEKDLWCPTNCDKLINL